MEKNLKN